SITAAQRPRASACSALIFKHLNLIAGLTQLQSCNHSGKARSENEHRGAVGVSFKFDRTNIIGFGGETETSHGLVHRRAAGRGPNETKQVSASHSGRTPRNPFVTHRKFSARSRA